MVQVSRTNNACTYSLTHTDTACLWLSRAHLLTSCTLLFSFSFSSSTGSVTGKTTFIKMLAGLLKPDDGSTIPLLNVSYKPQKIAPKFEGTVRQLLHSKIPASYTHPQFVSDVMKPMNIEDIIDQAVKNLSGGELQRE